MRIFRKIIIAILIVIIILGVFVLGGYFGHRSRADVSEPPGGEEPHVHSFSSEWSYGEKNHYHACECGTVKDIAAHTLENGVCTVCGAKFEEPHEHAFSSWEFNYRQHWQSCECGVETDRSWHSYVYQGENDVCTVCGAEREHEHTYDYEHAYYYDDRSHYYMANCGHDAMELFNHSFVDGICTACGAREHEHSYVESGLSYDMHYHYNYAVCECGDIIKSEISAHTYESGSNYCTVCGYHRGTVISPGGGGATVA